MAARRWIAGLLALTALAGCGGGGDPPPRPDPGPPPDPPLLRAGDLWRFHRLEQERRMAARRAELRALADDPSVGAALRRARLRRELGPRAYRDYRLAYGGARRAARRLTGARAAEQRAVLASVDALAASGQLVPGRFPAVFLNLRRNTRTWTHDPFPRPGERRTFGDHPAVFQYVPGRGIQLHQLATWGVANARARACLRWPGRCHRRALARRLERLAALAAPRGGFIAWEYYYAYAQGSPPWISGMSQATAVQALARGAAALHRRGLQRIARRALGAFETAPPTGVAVAAPGGTRYVMYSFAPTLQILNGELQAVNGLRDAAVLGRSPRAVALVAAGDRAARAALGRFDTGAWSLYSLAGGESTLSYHQLTTGFLGELCRRTRRAEYCSAQRRFARYEREPPRIGIAPLHGLWAHRPAPLRFTLSKGSSVQVRVYGPHGIVMARDLALARGGHDLAWTPPSRGRFRVRVQARGPEGRLGVSHRSVRVVLPKPKPKRRHEPEPRRRPGERRGAVDEATTGGVG